MAIKNEFPHMWFCIFYLLPLVLSYSDKEPVTYIVTCSYVRKKRVKVGQTLHSFLGFCDSVKSLVVCIIGHVQFELAFVSFWSFDWVLFSCSQNADTQNCATNPRSMIKKFIIVFTCVYLKKFLKTYNFIAVKTVIKNFLWKCVHNID